MRSVVPELRCDPEGLRALAAACEEHAIGVCIHEVPSVPSAPHQSTVAAVSGLHTATLGAADAFARRIRSTATALTTAADRYTRGDDTSTEALAASMSIDMK